MSLWMRTSVYCVILIGVICCVHLWHIGDEDLMHSYAVESFSHNKALASRLCHSDRHATVLYGVFSTAEKVLFRNATRQQVQCHLNNNVHNTVFVLGAPRTNREYTILNREATMYGDIFTLTCKENMNEGKTYTYFKEALEQFPCFDFYAKVDDDTAFVPAKLSSFIQSASIDTPVMIGRHRAFPTINEPFFWIGRLLWYSLRDVSWTRHMHDYCAGMLYVLNTPAIKGWIALNPTQLHGDEDMRTFYYMKIIGAAVLNTHNAFHDHISRGMTVWSEPITNASLAVHQCKKIELLSQTFVSLCQRE